MDTWKHQEIGIRKCLEQDEFALFFDVGTGKTRTIVEVLRKRYAQNGRVLKTIILCPQIVCGNWVNEFKKFSKINTKHEVINLGPLKGKKRIEAMTKAENHIVIVNYEAMRTQELFEAIAKWTPEVVICDESHKVKSYKAKASKQVQFLADRSSFRYLLTGTPYTNSIEDYFQQFRILDKGKTFGKNFWAFRARWMEDENAAWSGRPNHFPKWVPKRGIEKQFGELIARKSMRVKKSECLDLPPLIKQSYPVDLSPEQKKMYKEMKQDYIAFVRQETESGKPLAAVAQLAITKALRLQQIVTGFVTTDQKTEYLMKGNPRIAALREILEGIVSENKVIIWATFKQNYKDIAKMCEDMGIEYVELHGDVPKKFRDDHIKMFNEDPKVRVLIGNQGAGGIGINLVAANYMIYYSKDFSLEKDIQSEARNYRGGSEVHDKITRIDLVARDTIDAQINEALRNKINMSEKILDIEL